MIRKVQSSKFKVQSSNVDRLDRGEIVLMLVLIMVVGLTIGLSLISRTVTDVRISSQIEQSGKALSAAEAGIESALKGSVVGGPTGTVNLPEASANYSVSSVGGSTDVYSLPYTEVGKSQTVWLVDHIDDININENGPSYPSNAQIDICWGNNLDNAAAMIVSIYYKFAGSYKVAKAAYDPIPTRGNNFLPVVDTSGGYCNGNYQFKKSIQPDVDLRINSSASLLILRLTPVYQSSPIALSPSVALPLQGKLITSVGQTSTGVVRKINVSQGYAILPMLLDFVLFSEN